MCILFFQVIVNSLCPCNTFLTLSLVFLVHSPDLPLWRRAMASPDDPLKVSWSRVVFDLWWLAHRHLPPINPPELEEGRSPSTTADFRFSSLGENANSTRNVSWQQDNFEDENAWNLLHYQSGNEKNIFRCAHPILPKEYYRWCMFVCLLFLPLSSIAHTRIADSTPLAKLGEHSKKLFHSWMGL